MLYDLDTIAELSNELGFTTERRTPEMVAIELAPGVTLVFENWPDQDDCIVDFEGAGTWHGHGDLILDAGDRSVELDPLEVLTGLAKGEILIGESWVEGELEDRWLDLRGLFESREQVDARTEVRIRAASIATE